jgi:hypothetical protein
MQIILAAGEYFMSQDEEQQKRSRVVIQTPTARREVVETVVARSAPERRGVSTGVVAALVIGSVALVTLLFLFLLNRQSEGTAVTANVQTTSAPTPLPQQPIIVQQPTPLPQQAPIIIEQPSTTTTQPAPVIIQQPAPATTSPGTAPGGADDTAIQSAIDKRMAEDATLSTLGVTATVLDGKVTLIGTVDTAALKNQVERLVKAVKGVKVVDNQIIVQGG